MSFEYNDFSKFWDFFEGHIYCINLLSRNDRYESCKKIFEKYNIPVKFFRVEKHPKGGEYGCFDSHVKVVTKAYNEGAKRVLIFEDDLETSDSLTPRNLGNCIQFMKKNKNWDLFYFGIVPDVKLGVQKMSNNIYKVKGYCAHSYVMNRCAMKEMLGLRHDEIQKPIDDYYCDAFSSYAIFPSMFNQCRSTSDIKEMSGYKTTDYLKERYSYYVGFPIYFINIIAILFLTGWLVLNGQKYNYYIYAAILLLLILTLVEIRYF